MNKLVKPGRVAAMAIFMSLILVIYMVFLYRLFEKVADITCSKYIPSCKQTVKACVYHHLP